MAAIIASDVSIAANGDIRWTGAATTNRHTVLEFIQFLMDKQDDEQAAGDDLLDITVDTPFNRSTDQILSLNYPFNIDDTFAKHLYDGSVSQTDDEANPNNTLYSGINIIGPVVSGTEYMILQDGKVLPAFWSTGINPEASPSLVFSRHLIKSRERGADIDGKRITVLARELGDQYRRFPATLGTGNTVAAISNGADIFNETPDATIAGWTNITNVEGFQEIDIDKTGAAGQEYYSQWNRDTQTINDVYERSKWFSQRSHEADANAEGGNDFIIDDNDTTSLGVGTEWSASASGEILTGLTASIKIGAGAPTGFLYALLYDSDDAGTAAPTGAILARSEPILASEITSSYEDILFQFNRINPNDGSSQLAGLTLVADQEYFFVIKHDEGLVGDYFHAEGDTTTADDGNFARETPAATFTGVGTSALQFSVKTSPEIHTIPGDRFEGISIEVGYDGEQAAGILENEFCFWGSKIFYDTLTGNFQEGEYVAILRAGAFQSGGRVLHDDAVDEMVLALENPASGILADGDTLTGLTSGATCVINTGGGAIEDEDLGGGIGLVLADDDNAAAGELYLQIIAGVNPVDNSRIRSDTAPLVNYVDATAVLNPRTIVPEFLGTSTGSNIIGAYGIGFEALDVGSSDRFTSLDDAPRVPPNNVDFTVSGLVAGEDRVLVGPRAGTLLDTGQWLVATLLSANNETVLVVKTGTDTVPFPDAEENWPDAGVGAQVSRLRVARDDGIFKRLPYASHDGADTFTLALPDSGTLTLGNPNATQFTRSAGSFLDDGFENGCRFTSSGFTTSNGTFTVESVSADGLTITTVEGGLGSDGAGSGDENLIGIGWNFASATAGMDEAAINNEAFLAFIDVLAGSAEEVFTGVHTPSNDRDLFVRVRDGGGTPIKTFEAITAQFLATAQTIAATRTSDE